VTDDTKHAISQRHYLQHVVCLFAIMSFMINVYLH